MSTSSRPPSARSLWPLVIALMTLITIGAVVAAVWWSVAGPSS